MSFWRFLIPLTRFQGRRDGHRDDSRPSKEKIGLAIRVTIVHDLIIRGEGHVWLADVATLWKEGSCSFVYFGSWLHSRH